MTTHPAEVNSALGTAHSLCGKLIEDAERRGDQSGADAWLVARDAIEAAEKAMREARNKQNWSRRELNEMPRQDLPRPSGCTCLGACLCSHCGRGASEGK